MCDAITQAPSARWPAALRPAPALPPPPRGDDCGSLLACEGAGRELVAQLEHRNHRAALRGLAVATASLVDPSEVDMVTWAPTTPQRRRSRGFDQSELIARVI